MPEAMITREILNWMSDHWVLTVTLSLIAALTYAVPKVICTFVIADRGMR